MASSSSTPLNHNIAKTNFPPFLKTKSNKTLITFPTFSSSPKFPSLHSTTAGYNEVVLDEEMGKIRRLQNGSDVRGVAVEGEKGRAVDMTPPAVEAIAESFGEWVISELGLGVGEGEVVKVSLGRDPRISGGVLSVAVFAGLARAGCVGIDMGLATTPACFMSTLLHPFAYHASIMMTASHLPYTRNGLKFFTRKGGLTSPQVEEICEKAARKYANRFTRVSTLLRVLPTKVDFMSTYSQHLRDIIKERVNHPLHYDTPLQGFQSTWIRVTRLRRSRFSKQVFRSGTVPTMSGIVEQALSISPNLSETVMKGFKPENVPIYASLVNEFAVFGRWFSSIAGPTQPNRLFVYSATSHGSTGHVKK